MNAIRRPLPLVLVIAVAASSGALASTLLQRATIAASAPAVQDPALTALLKHVSVDPAGKVHIGGNGFDMKINSDVTIEANNITINATTAATMSTASNTAAIKLSTRGALLNGPIIDVNGGAKTTIEGMAVSITGAGVTSTCCPIR